MLRAHMQGFDGYTRDWVAEIRAYTVAVAAGYRMCRYGEIQRRGADARVVCGVWTWIVTL